MNVSAGHDHKARGKPSLVQLNVGF